MLMPILTTALLIAFSTLPARSQVTTAQEQPPQVVGNGSIDILLEPKRAVLLLGLAGEGPDGPGAIAKLQELDQSVRAALGGTNTRVIPWGIGIGENQQVRRMIMSSEPGLITSRDYLARSGLALEIADVSSVASIVATLAAAGVKNLTGALFVADEADPALTEATRRATLLARSQAETIAAAAGGNVGRLIRITTAPAYPQNFMQRFNWSDQTGVPLTPSEIAVRITVQGTWEFVPR